MGDMSKQSTDKANSGSGTGRLSENQGDYESARSFNGGEFKPAPNKPEKDTGTR